MNDKKYLSLNGLQEYDARIKEAIDAATAEVLPVVAEGDAGKFLRVSAAGDWSAETIPSAEGEAF